MIHETPRALAFDSALVTWSTFVIVKALPALITIGTLCLIIIRLLIAWREWRGG